MNKEKINSLENEIKEKSFYLSNKDKNNIWDILGILFQCLNVIICFFGLFLFLSNVVDDFIYKQYILGSISILLLVIWEKLKRLQIRNSSMSLLKNENKIVKSNVTNIIVTTFLVVCSSLIAIRGGYELSDKKDKIEVKTKVNTNNIKDSISSLYNNDIKEYKDRITFIYKNAKTRDGETRSLYKNEQSVINELDFKIKGLSLTRDSLIKSEILLVNNSNSEKKDENKSVVKIFVISSILFEIFILISIYYCSYFDYKSYFEITEDENYIKKNIYIQYLDILFEDNSLSKDDKIMSEKKFTDIIKLKFNNKRNLTKEFFSVISLLKISVSRSDKRKYINKNYKDSIKLIEIYFNKN